ncbi:hypothetical protein MPTK1_4g12880 [Marchantia polymorpha subsp. ruderalis]|uniref:Uncharacterized protein n=2 Tax=Marchantia polymorpha TaxID=3197 RepID=A0AAF6B9B8_MARPO|nr:hypothetical protein MARPO_0138s0026 [Marchantia polymorpha]BBN08602.1 hypothetical protein Mp_4g12880 [Marchantia polymorpha subsp. ruderalis]|eukprot:PTQ29590.1 hypothetical protein MARPO_0138s0026 [Marchantia polymorpha]
MIDHRTRRFLSGNLNGTYSSTGSGAGRSSSGGSGRSRRRSFSSAAVGGGLLMDCRPSPFFRNTTCAGNGGGSSFTLFFLFAAGAPAAGWTAGPTPFFSGASIPGFVLDEPCGAFEARTSFSSFEARTSFSSFEARTSFLSFESAAAAAEARAFGGCDSAMAAAGRAFCCCCFEPFLPSLISSIVGGISAGGGARAAMIAAHSARRSAHCLRNSSRAKTGAHNGGRTIFSSSSTGSALAAAMSACRVALLSCWSKCLCNLQLKWNLSHTSGASSSRWLRKNSQVGRSAKYSFHIGAQVLSLLEIIIRLRRTSSGCWSPSGHGLNHKLFRFSSVHSSTFFLSRSLSLWKCRRCLRASAILANMYLISPIRLRLRCQFHSSLIFRMWYSIFSGSGSYHCGSHIQSSGLMSRV